MEYEKPELTAVTSAIRAIQSIGSKQVPDFEDCCADRCQPISCYEDDE